MRLLALVHGHLGVLAIVSCLHPAITLRHGQPLRSSMRWSIALAAALVSCAFVVGLAIYEPYRELVKPALFRASVHAGLLFETKEHLAFCLTALALGAGACAWLAPEDAPSLRRLAARLFAGVVLLGLVVISLGLATAARQIFAN